VSGAPPEDCPSPVKILPTPRTVSAAQQSSSLGRGMDFALVMLVFLGIGALIDRWLGTWPAFAIGLVLFSVVGQFVKMYYEYNATMEQLEAERAQSRQARPASTSPSEQAA